MPVKKGRLKPEDDVKIVKNYAYLKDNFDPTDGTLDYMISAMVFDRHDNDKVRNGGENTQRGRAERFIDILQNSGQGAYQVFLEALKHYENDYIVTQLESTDTVPSRAGDVWLDHLTEQQKTRLPSDAQASRLSGAFGEGWQHLFSQLGIPKAKMDQIRMSNPHSSSVVIKDLIIHWRQKNGRKAQFIVLLQAMQSVNDQCTINWEIVEKVAKESDEV